MGSLTIRLDERLQADLERIALQQGRSKSELVRDVLRRYTTAELFELARAELRPFAEREGFISDEDFFREFS